MVHLPPYRGRIDIRSPLSKTCRKSTKRDDKVKYIKTDKSLYKPYSSLLYPEGKKINIGREHVLMMSPDDYYRHCGMHLKRSVFMR